MLKDKIIVLNHYSQFSKDDKEVIEELIVRLVTARDSMRLKPEYKMGLENYLEWIWIALYYNDTYISIKGI